MSVSPNPGVSIKALSEVTNKWRSSVAWVREEIVDYPVNFPVKKDFPLSFWPTNPIYLTLSVYSLLIAVFLSSSDTAVPFLVISTGVPLESIFLTFSNFILY